MMSEPKDIDVRSSAKELAALDAETIRRNVRRNLVGVDPARKEGGEYTLWTEETLSAPEAARIANVTAKTIREWVATIEGFGVKRVGRWAISKRKLAAVLCGEIASTNR